MSRLKNKRREISAALLGISVAVILWVTILCRETVVGDPFMYQPFHALFSFWNSIKRQGFSGNFLGNIMIFIPVGLLYPIAFGMESKKKMRRTILFGFFLSVLIEFAQLVSSKGFFDLDDIVLNTLGTLIGYGLNNVWT